MITAPIGALGWRSRRVVSDDAGALSVRYPIENALDVTTTGGFSAFQCFKLGRILSNRLIAKKQEGGYQEERSYFHQGFVATVLAECACKPTSCFCRSIRGNTRNLQIRSLMHNALIRLKNAG